MRAVAGCQRASSRLAEQEIFWVGLPSLAEPCAKILRRLGTEEPRAVLLPFSASDVDRSGTKVRVLDAEPQRFANAKATVREQGDQRFVPPSLKGVRAREQ
jgi:hypothetical protein